MISFGTTSGEYLQLNIFLRNLMFHRFKASAASVSIGPQLFLKWKSLSTMSPPSLLITDFQPTCSLFAHILEDTQTPVWSNPSHHVIRKTSSLSCAPSTCTLPARIPPTTSFYHRSTIYKTSLFALLVYSSPLYPTLSTRISSILRFPPPLCYWLLLFAISLLHPASLHSNTHSLQ